MERRLAPKIVQFCVAALANSTGYYLRAAP
jgi:hypothetical protein